jgi:hypothetical protein
MRLLLLMSVIWAATAVLAEEFERVDPAFPMLESVVTGARSEALGDADITFGGGPGVFQLNPSALSAGEGIEVEISDLDYRDDYDLSFDYDNRCAGVDWRGLRIAVARRTLAIETHVFDIDDPDGPGALFKQNQRVVVAGVGYDLGRLIAPGSAWRFSVGAAYRHYRMYDEAMGDAAEYGQGSLDGGLTVGWRWLRPGPRLAIQAAAARQNCTDETIILDAVELPLPRVWRFGFGLEATTNLGREFVDGLRLRAAYTRSSRIGTGRTVGADQVGLEAVLLRVVALRVGHDSTHFKGNTGYGAALILDQAWLEPISAAFEWTRIDPEMGWEEDRDVYGVRVRIAL